MSIETFPAVAGASGLACGLTAAGIFAISVRGRWARERAVYFQAFAAGVLITIALLHLVERSQAMNASAPGWILAGFFVLYLTSRFLHAHLCPHGEEEGTVMGVVPLVAIGFHSLLDGVIYSVTFSAALFTGVLAAVGMILHEVPEGIISYVLLRRGGFSSRRSVLFAFLAAGLSTPLGAVASFPFVDRVGERSLGALLGLSAGALLFVGASHLLPEVERHRRKSTLAALAAGVAVGVAMLAAKHAA